MQLSGYARERRAGTWLGALSDEKIVVISASVRSELLVCDGAFRCP